MTEPNLPLRSRLSGPAVTLRISILLGLISLFLSLSMLPNIPRSSLNLAIALAGVVAALRVRSAQKATTDQVRVFPALLVSLVAAATGLLSLGAALILHTEIARYEECSAGAITHAAATICQNQLRDDINARVAHLRSSKP